MAYLTIEVILFEHPACQFFHPGLEIMECIEYRLSGLIKTVHFIGFNHRGIDIIAP
jgi:hypothetical protein